MKFYNLKTYSPIDVEDVKNLPTKKLNEMIHERIDQLDSYGNTEVVKVTRDVKIISSIIRDRPDGTMGGSGGGRGR